MPMYGSSYVFSEKFFTGWVSVGIIWIFLSFFAVGLFPIVEGHQTLFRVIKYIALDLTGKPPMKHGRAENHNVRSGGEVIIQAACSSEGIDRTDAALRKAKH